MPRILVERAHENGRDLLSGRPVVMIQRRDVVPRQATHVREAIGRNPFIEQ
jgi:hypothetical protein